MRRRGAATSTHDPDTGSNEALGVARHILGGGKVQISPFKVSRFPRVGLRCDLSGNHARHPLDALQHHLGSHAAVDTHDVRSQLLQVRAESFGRGSVQAVAVFLQGQLRHDREVAQLFGRENGGLDLPQIRKGLQAEQIHAAFHQGRDLLGENPPGFFHSQLSVRLEADSERPDRSAHIGRALCDLLRNLDA